jgi:hypothetical protein
MKRRYFLGTLALSITAATLFSESVLGQAQLIDDLRQGGHVIYFRHGTKGKAVNTESKLPQNLQQCLLPQEPLTAAGVTMMKTIGNSFATLNIPVGKVYSSPVCRCVESAWYGFKQAEVYSDLNGIIPEGVKNQAKLNEKWAATMRRMFSAVPAQGTNTIITAHASNLQSMTGLALDEGEAAIFKPDGKGGFTYIERIKAEVWSSLTTKP